MSFCRRSAHIRSDRSDCVVSESVCCEGASVLHVYVCVCVFSLSCQLGPYVSCNMVPVCLTPVMNMQTVLTNHCIILQECWLYMHVFLCLHLMPTLSQMQVSQLLTCSDLDEKLDSGVLGNLMMVWDSWDLFWSSRGNTCEITGGFSSGETSEEQETPVYLHSHCLLGETAVIL